MSQTVTDYRTTRKRKLTMIIKHSNDVTFFSDATEVLRDTEAGPACLWWFICIRIVHRRNYTDNGTTMNVVNSIERIEDALYTVQEKINIISSLRFEGSTRYPGVTAPTAWTLSGSNDTTFTDIQSYEKTNWSTNIAAAFDVTTDHIPYRFYRVTFTRVTAGSGSTYVSVPDITFITVHPIGAHLLSVYPVSTNTFKIIMGNAEGRIMNMIGSPMAAWKFFITILKGGRIANTGMYTLSSTGFTKTS
ncbi:hypothetical protein T492DRAFT_1130714 [Pavlovales sp. CCMP2436]|nr:hypothetical protein T492DRAFT_1130714 [Pavlovales sp. CCMP2436]